MALSLAGMGFPFPRRPSGQYQLTFPQTVAACAAVASIGASQNGSALEVGVTAAHAGYPGPSVVRVETWSVNGSLVHKPFNVAVFC